MFKIVTCHMYQLNLTIIKVYAVKDTCFINLEKHFTTGKFHLYDPLQGHLQAVSSLLVEL